MHLNLVCLGVVKQASVFGMISLGLVIMGAVKRLANVVPVTPLQLLLRRAINIIVVIQLHVLPAVGGTLRAGSRVLKDLSARVLIRITIRVRRQLPHLPQLLGDLTPKQNILLIPS